MTTAKIREIVPTTETVTTARVNHTKETLRDWLQAKMTDTTYLLAHADDGVIWGHLVDGQLVTAHDAVKALDHNGKRKRLLAVCPPLDWRTLWEARVFDDNQMYHLWGRGDDWMCTHYTSIANGDTDIHKTFTAVVDEQQLTWGMPDSRYNLDGFTVMRDGQQGLVHVVPFPVKNDHRLQLRVRHYVKEDEHTGFNYITASRLLGLTQQGDNNG